MQAGKLNKFVQVMRQTGTEQFGIGGHAEEVVRGCMANVRPNSGTERVSGQQVQQATSHVVRMRWHPEIAIDSSHWLMLGGRRLEIRGVYNDEERNRELVLFCDEVAR